MSETSTPVGRPHEAPRHDGLDPQAVQRLMAEMTRLLETSTSAGEFEVGFVRTLAEAVRASGGALWAARPGAGYEPGEHTDVDALGLDEVGGWDAHAGLLRVAAERDRPLWVAPQSSPAVAEPAEPGCPIANLTNHTLLLAAARSEGRTVAVLELWFRNPPDARSRRVLAELVAELTGFVAAYDHKSRLRELAAQQGLWAQLEGFLRQLHRSLDPREVSAVVANEGRRLLGCDQVAVALRRHGRIAVAAVSGAPTVDDRGRLATTLAALCDRVLAWGEPLTFEGRRDETLPPAVLDALDRYLSQSNCRALIVRPLGVPGAAPGPARAALVAEVFGPAPTAEAVARRLEPVAAHAALAIDNALTHDELPLRCVTRPLATLRRGWTASRWLRVGAAAALVTLTAGALAAVHVPLRVEAKGQLLPQERQTVFAAVAGKVVDLKARHGDVVTKGQELVFIEDLDAQLQVDQLNLRIGAAEQRLALVGDQLGKNPPPERQDALLRDRIDQEYDLRKAAAERDVWLQGSRTPRKTPVVAPLAGKVVTFDAAEALVGKSVKPGDPLLRVAHTRGAWEVNLLIPEWAMGHVRDGLLRSPDGAVDVDLLLSSQPHRRYRGRLTQAGLGGEAGAKDGVVTVPARVELADDELGRLAQDLPVGAEVRARVDCGRRPAGYVWLYPLWEFVYETLLF